MPVHPIEDTVDLLVVGGGTAGLVGAHTAAALGARTVLVEHGRTGGDCLWTGCVPSKALLAAASAAASARRASSLGVDVGEVRVEFARVRAHVRAAITAVQPKDSPEALEKAGVSVLTGSAVFTGPDTARIGERSVRFSAALLATGADPAMPPIDGMETIEPLTSETLWDVEELPRRLVVLGGGPIGCELGQAFARLGSAVTVVDGSDRLLEPEDPDAAALVAAALQRDGAQLRLGSQGVRIEPGVLHLDDGTALPFDRLLVAVGRRPRTTGLGLDAAGVDLDDDGSVTLDAALRTTNRRIWAAGDVTGPPFFTHTAGMHGSVAASNAVLGLARRIDPVVPRVTFTSPEVASVGLSPAEAAGSGCTVRRVEHAAVDRAVAEGETEGFTSLVLDRRHRVVGAVVVGPRAGETLGELTLAVRQRLTAGDLAGTTHAYPTYDDAIVDAALDDVRARLANPLVRGALRAAVWVRGRLRGGQRSER
ncbi:pyruvate/2-oxoglutarate dehydrogenase complex dihydrolipoamide dehydrogenase (E3) component [Blastococcus colisei]|uniref:Pyruvate/2-oxoglutarate dehydrogenase complex dihydrolipoamide dehydrogenase (E3) component n=1 Tax=Blastococcus colisei TaxID=1564162 RepID=A0A543PA22_9ACTN|nr:FAD-dependent oxidoreductase [Blastococcus colisei]TQN40926.1 pyruvate/2-oxoglutarate dehydrogenase complex dihydrolipoamide dehydrogenase (E3) component [Blastococcus colisei]